MNIIDFTQKDAHKKFFDSLKETGFAVINPGFDFSNVLERAYDEWERFFMSEDKHSYIRKPDSQSGFFPFKSEKAKDSDIKDLKEFYHLYRGDTLPEGIREATADLFHMLESSGERLLMLIEQNLPEEIQKGLSLPLGQMAQDSPSTLFRVLHYPPLSSNEDPNAVRASAHEDINLITLLPAATDAGLQLLNKNGKWINVPSSTNTIIVNVGDMLMEATGGLLKSTTHRVINPNPKGSAAKRSRYSMPLFIHPKPCVRLSERYTAQEYLDQRLKEIGLK